ncbi:hypothetical protein [Bradyrhizobium sp. SZCCHNS1054]|uniref:hypothetical protein n=1 Tax=Bradyrhizobium sp. SZCCHNS1054 TaxID=3057301 RepID=UPI002916C378|nr:hypothetical protein [Bradyrhizobium sp. SZCCHNS1054]
MSTRRIPPAPGNPALDRAVEMANAAFAISLVLNSPLTELHPHDRAMLLQTHFELSWPFAQLENDSHSRRRDPARPLKTQ